MSGWYKSLGSVEFEATCEEHPNDPRYKALKGKDPNSGYNCILLVPAENDLVVGQKYKLIADYGLRTL